jgi:hypothetical protein
MKTFIGLSMTKALLTGRPLFGNPAFAVRAVAEKVVYLIPESSLRPLKMRLEKLGLTPFIGKSLFVRTVDVDQRLLVLDDEDLLDGLKGAFVFLDTMARFMKGEENALSEDQRDFTRQLFGLLSHGAKAVIGLHHATKAAANENTMTLENMLRGSGDIATQPAMVWGIQKYDEERSRVKFKCLKSRDLHPTPKPFAIEGSPWIDQEGDFRMLAEDQAPPVKGDGPTPEQIARVDDLLAMKTPIKKINRATGVPQVFIAARRKAKLESVLAPS